MNTQNLDLAGIGIGPFNLSLAALLDPVPRVRALFFERNRSFRWHPGLLLTGAKLQTSCFKDLVTAVDPTSPYSFFSYLVSKGRFYRFLCAEFGAVERREFADYLSWASQQLPSLRFGQEVREVDFRNDRFRLRLSHGELAADNLVVATGRQPAVPDWAAGDIGDRCFHAGDVGLRRLDLTGRRVALVGGGQTGAELVLHLLDGRWGRPERIIWLSRRPNFEPLDETAFTNEYFTPSYVQQFHKLPQQRRDRIVEAQKLASDGISPETLKALYQRLYVLRYIEQDERLVQLLPNREVSALDRNDGDFDIIASNGFNGEIESYRADDVILCTGYESRFPVALEPLRHRLALDRQGRFRLDGRFAAAWDGPTDRRIYVQNAGRHSHGIAEPQLSLMAWRAATIVNDLLGRAHYPVEEPAEFVQWASDESQALAVPTASVIETRISASASK